MTSNEIICRYLTGSFMRSQTLEELTALSARSANMTDWQEAAKARYALGFLERLQQYQRGDASANDLCMNLRDLVLFVGRVCVSQPIFDLVREKGREFGLVCERDQIVSCNTHYPKWLEHTKFINDVYRFKLHDDWELEAPSPGDLLLSSNTIFTSYKSFEQKLAVHTALNLPGGHTLLVSQPTGGGKSLVTQMLAALTPGLTGVIVPTVALALDQFHSAKRNLKTDDNIFCYRGDQKQEDREKLLNGIRDRSARLLFTSPEAVFKNSELLGLLESAASDRYLRNIVVDEAHVVPDWGVFFRPDFQIFSIVLQKWRKRSSDHIRTYLLSATLSDDVVETLFTLFGKNGKNAEVRCDALRQEPRFYFSGAKTKREKDEKTIEAIKLLPKPMVVYVLEPQEATDLQKKLQSFGFKNIPTFTGRTKDADRDAILQGWKSNYYDVVIATSAFGIGIDKPDVRTIIHSCVPENLSRFYQEVGRGGRDGLPSISLLLPYNGNQDGEGDLGRAFGLVKKRVLRVENIVSRWFGMLSNKTSVLVGDIAVLDTSATPLTMDEDEAEYAGNRNIAWNVNLLLFLHRIGFITLEDAYYNPENRSYFMSLKLIRPEELGDKDSLSEALKVPRQTELGMQLDGYHIMSRLVQHPTSSCWGTVFRKLFPLSKETCSGCPVHPNGNYLTDSRYKLRQAPAIISPPSPACGRVKRQMGTYNKLIIRRQSEHRFDKQESQLAADYAAQGGISSLVVPSELKDIDYFPGLILTYDEFIFTVRKTPYLLAGGVLCIFCYDPRMNSVLLASLLLLDAYGYNQILYCKEDILLPHTQKPILESIDCYCITETNC